MLPRRNRWALLVGVGLLTTMLAAGMLAAPVGGGLASHSAPLHTASSASVSPRPFAVPGIVMTYKTTLRVFESLNFTLTYVATVTGATISPTNFSTWVEVYDVTVETPCANISLNSSVATGVTTYSVGINKTSLGTALANPSCDLLTDVTGFIAHGNITTTAGSNTSSAEISTRILGLEPTVGGFLSPAGTSFGVGSITFVAYASGQYITTAAVVVTLNKTIEFSSILIGSSTFRGLYNPVSWSAVAGGTYNTSLQLSTSYGNTTYYNATLTVSSASGTTLTQTNWNNNTLIPGISGPIAGTLLMVIGLIVGMVSAFAVARWTMAPKPSAPQAWTGGPAPKAANTCSTCGASFATAEELQAHAKSEHGMG